jgi:hypothetical protein
MEKQLEIVGEEVIYTSPTGTFRKVRTWVKGWHRELGQLVWGITGQETMIEKDCIRAMGTVEVKGINIPAALYEPPQTIRDILHISPPPILGTHT